MSSFEYFKIGHAINGLAVLFALEFFFFFEMRRFVCMSTSMMYGDRFFAALAITGCRVGPSFVQAQAFEL